jgi:hypothetical protein
LFAVDLLLPTQLNYELFVLLLPSHLFSWLHQIYNKLDRPKLHENFSKAKQEVSINFNLSGEYLAVSPFWYHLKAHQLYE